VGYDGLILMTSNGGKNWIRQQSNTGASLRTVCFINELKGFAGGADGKFIRTTNGGETWIDIPINTHKIISDIFFINDNIGWFVGDSSLIAKTTDGGTSWNLKEEYTEQGIFSIHMIDENEGWCVGFNLLLKTTDGGNNWEFQNSLGSNTWQVIFINHNLGYVLSYNNLFYVTIDGGLTWNSSYISNSIQDFYAMSFTFIDSLNGWIAGDTGKIFKTIDGGLSWTQQNSGTLNLLYTIYFVDNNVGYAAGQNGTILKTTNGGVTFIEDENNFTQPKDFLLQQNSPNPFNPSTSIQYAINSTQFVTLKVYDLLGREVATLVNEEKIAGKYEVDFNASSLASGIYFYKLQSGNFVQTRKMILLK